MITAVKQGHSSAKALEQVAAIKESFGIRGQALEEMLE
jgi:hypothetical protein